MDELIKTITQSEGLSSAIRKGYVVRVWKTYKEGRGEVVNVRMVSEWFATETFFVPGADLNFVDKRVIELYLSVVRYYDGRFET